MLYYGVSIFVNRIAVKLHIEETNKHTKKCPEIYPVSFTVALLFLTLSFPSAKKIYEELFGLYVKMVILADYLVLEVQHLWGFRP